MLVYGDVEESRSAAELAGRAIAQLEAAASAPPGLRRHMALVDGFLAFGDLLRCRLDAAMPDADDVAADAAGPAALTALAGAVDQSWTSGFTAPPDLASPLAYLRRQRGSERFRIKPLEGYAFYALYPEAYAEAARRSGLPPETRVIGIRSIGLGLAAMAAAAIGAAPAVSVRPRGHPFDRRLALSPRLAEELLAGDPPAYAVVDEGPGLSGSSFGCVADSLVAQGVPRERIHFFPSHLDLGSQASADRRRHWAAAPRHVVGTDELLLPDRLAAWLEDCVGARCSALVEISGGGWRAHLGGRVAESPAAPAFERRKFLATMADGNRWSLRFAGLGETGEAKLRLARQLHAAGFGPEPAGLVHGFLVQRWIEAPSLCDAPLPRRSLVEQLAAYLAFRAGLAAPADGGATLPVLAEMARYNTAEALGPEIAARLDGLLDGAERLEPRVQRVRVDARLHSWEWLVRDGQLIKLDALDHAQAHDFVGAQDIAWDVAGAIVEHDLDGDQRAHLLQALGARGIEVDADLLAFLLPCYLAFQLGYWTMGAGLGEQVTDAYAQRLAALV